jgi:hypothetical protein
VLVHDSCHAQALFTLFVVRRVCIGFWEKSY